LDEQKRRLIKTYTAKLDEIEKVLVLPKKLLF